MAVRTDDPANREVTRKLLAEIAAGDRGAQLRAVVAKWNPGATTEQIDESFQEACARADRACRGTTEGEVYVWLRTTTHRELGRLRRRARREVPVDATEPSFEAMRATARGPVDELTEAEDQAELEQLTQAVLARLSDRQRAVAALHTRGMRRQQIAECLELTPRTVKRSLEQILTAGRDELVRLAGHGCPDGESLVSRLAFGLAGPRDARRAQLHLTGCARCGAMYERLDLWREKVAGLLPLPAAEEAHSHVIERVVHVGSDVLSGSHEGAARTSTGLRRHASDALSHLRDQAAAAYYRSVDPTPLAGVRPGAVAATLAGCLAVGSGATYCVQHGIEPIISVGSVATAEHHHKQRPEHEHVRARAAQVTPAPVATPAMPALPQRTPTVQATPVATNPPPTPTPSPTAVATVQATPPPAPQDEFEPTSEGSGGASTAQAASSSATRAASPSKRKPAPAPRGGAGEFGGP